MPETLDHKILSQLGKIHGEMREGFKNVHRRQDIANGRTAKNEASIEELKIRNAFEEGKAHYVESEKKSNSFEEEIAPIIEGRHAREWIGKRLLYAGKIVGSITIISIFIYDILNLIHPHL